MKYLFIALFLTLSVVGCGNRNNNGNKFDLNQQTSWPEISPEMVVVKVDARTGQVYYTTVSAFYGENNYRDLIHSNQMSFQRQSSGSVILHSYPEQPSEQLYFVENVNDFKRGRREINSYYYSSQNSGYYYYNCSYQYGYWGYYNYCGSAYSPFYHYYPTSWSYQYEYRYQPAWYGNSVYYYYTPSYYYEYHGYYYYFYLR